MPSQSRNLGNNLTTMDEIVRYQTARLGKPFKTFSAQQLGFEQVVNKGNNLYKLVESGRLKMVSCVANSREELVICLQNNSGEISAQIMGGTLLLPDRSELSQTLICQKDQVLKVLNGLSTHKIGTFCHDLQRDSPQHQQYILANVKNIFYKQGMNQQQVWLLTVTSAGTMKPLQQWGPENKNLAFFTKKQLTAIIAKW